MYKRVVYQTIEWLQREMLTKEGAFYSALDADSEGEEGKFYCWKPKELQELLGEDYAWAKDFYAVNQRGFWEEDKYILLRTESDQEFTRKMNWTIVEFEDTIAKLNQKLLDERTHRVRPGTDDKCLTSWNAMTLKGLCQAYSAFGEEEFLQLAHKNARWILESQLQEDGKLLRNYKNGKANIPAFLEDYAHVIDAFIDFYQITFDMQWLEKAQILTQTTLEHFHDSTSQMFYFTQSDTSLIARKMELNDNVLPASNSVMATNLFRLGQLYYHKEYLKISEQMVANIYDGMEIYGSGYSNWGSLLLHIVNDYYLLTLVGKEVEEERKNLQHSYLPHVIFAGGNELNLPVLADKKSTQETTFYVCYKGTCLPPTTNTEEVLRSLELRS